MLLIDTGLIREILLMQDAGYGGLSWETHDFLDAIRDDDSWDQVKQHVEERGKDASSLPFEIIKSVAINLATDLLTSSGG